MSASRSSRSAPRLSELEGVALGIVHQLGTASAYDVRRRLAASPSTQWSASAGAVYPLVRKLVEQGLLRAVGAPAGPRGRVRHALTAAGRRALRAWVGPPLPSVAETVSHDPLRTRLSMLELLTPAERAAWVREARALLDQVEANVQQWHHDHADAPMADLLTRAGLADVRARRSWLRELLDE